MMCRFGPERQEEVAERTGFLPMIMKGKTLNGYCYVEPAGFNLNKDFQYWINLCLDYNDRAKPSKRARQKKSS
jgi:hypothetical protein